MAGMSQPIIVFPRRSRLLRFALLYALAAGIMVIPVAIFVNVLLDERAPFLIRWVVVVALAVCFAALCLLLIIMLGCTLFRLVVRKPSITVTDMGIVDGCSLIAGGMGLIRWDEITLVRPMVYKEGKRHRYAYLVILLRDPQAVLGRRGVALRAYRRAIAVIVPGGLGLPDWMFTISADELWQRISTQYGDRL